MIPRQYVEEVKNRSSAVDIIGSYVQLKRAGSNYTACCPFHSEKTPSFTVYPDDNSFYCYGCGVGGSIITFIQRIEALDYQDALRFLADRAGVRIPEDTGSYEPRKMVSRERLYAMNVDAARFFRNILYGPLGSSGMDYVKNKRHMTDASIRRFGLGFAPKDGNVFIRYMTEKGYTSEEMVQGFLARYINRDQTFGDGPVRALFRNRLMFPIIDTSKRVVAFGGRVMDDSLPKYLNSSDTPAFKKMKTLYALNYAKDSGSDTMILCEGYMDVIALHSAGITNAVATLGTAITPEHARMLTRFVKKCTLLYDSDAAGQRADEKAMRILSEVGLEVRVLKLDGAKDPDEYLQKFGKDRLVSALKETKSGFEFKLDSILAQYDLNQPERQVKAASDVSTLIAGYYSPIEREVYIREASKRLHVTVQTLTEAVSEKIKKQDKGKRAKDKQSAIQEVNRYGDRYHGTGSDDLAAIYTEENIIGMLLLDDSYRNLVYQKQVDLTDEDFVTEFGKRAFSAIMQLQGEEFGFEFALLGEACTSEEMGRLTMCMHKRKELSNSFPIFRDCVAKLKEIREETRSGNADFDTWLAAAREKSKTAEESDQNK